MLTKILWTCLPLTEPHKWSWRVYSFTEWWWPCRLPPVPPEPNIGAVVLRDRWRNMTSGVWSIDSKAHGRGSKDARMGTVAVQRDKPSYGGPLCPGCVSGHIPILHKHRKYYNRKYVNLQCIAYSKHFCIRLEWIKCQTGANRLSYMNLIKP